MPDAQITVLGAGIVGICTAISLLERGASVRVIDRGAPGQETSMGNAGVISPWSIIPQSTPGIWKTIPKLMFGRMRPLAIRPAIWPKMLPWGLRFLGNATEEKLRTTAEAMSVLCGPSIELYQRHLDGTGHEALIRSSCYVHAFRKAEKASLDALDNRLRKEKGAPIEVVGADALRQIEPALSHDFKAAVLIHNQARTLSPGRLGAVLAEKAERMGAQFIRDDIRSLQRSGEDWHVTGEKAVYKAEKIVVCLGAWSTQVLKPLGISLPLLTERGYHVQYPASGVELHNSVMDTDAKVVASSMEGGLRVAGQAEFAPVDALPDPGRKTLLRKIARTMFPDLNDTDPAFWMGRRPSFADSLPVIASPRNHPGLYLNFGHSHYGLMMAPKSAELAASMVQNAPVNEDLAAYQADRFYQNTKRASDDFNDEA